MIILHYEGAGVVDFLHRKAGYEAINSNVGGWPEEGVVGIRTVPGGRKNG
jgi:hypothetical protein